LPNLLIQVLQIAIPNLSADVAATDVTPAVDDITPQTLSIQLH